VVAVGGNDQGQLDIPLLPEKVLYTHISSSGDHIVFLRSDGSAVACGDNNAGQCDIPELPRGTVYMQASAGFQVLLL
jgi:alpha-tubulin suppressor-like RCC1 family protein